uniref:Ig-like domain-containing protein n=1 Tax=Erpetoichthys calabaricus TaxID=27687 RepID=A0A8C4T9Y4_ERPCA
MAATILLLTSLSISGQGDSAWSCQEGWPCQLALASHNPVFLDCPSAQHSSISWHFLNLSVENSSFVPFINSSGLIEGDLKLKDPQTSDSGIFLCQDGDRLLAYFETDFQDALQLHVSHAVLDQNTRPLEMVALDDGRELEMYTHWSGWQACDRCDAEGERRRLGFCYARLLRGSDVPGEPEPLPCGLMRVKLGAHSVPALSRGPELRIETCMETCRGVPAAGIDKEIPILLKDTFLAQLREPVELRCPRASVYNPVYWKRDDTILTLLQLLTLNGTHSLDRVTGGAIYRISHAFPSDAGTYRCYANRTETGIFLVKLWRGKRKHADQTFPFFKHIILITVVIFNALTLATICSYMGRNKESG